MAASLALFALIFGACVFLLTGCAAVSGKSFTFNTFMLLVIAAFSAGGSWVATNVGGIG